MENKFELTEEFIVNNSGIILYRIKALKDFSDVKKGDLGGYVQQERNLSQFGNSWIYDNAWVYDDAKVFGDVIASGEHVYDTN